MKYEPINIELFKKNREKLRKQLKNTNPKTTIGESKRTSQKR